MKTYQNGGGGGPAIHLSDKTYVQNMRNFNEPKPDQTNNQTKTPKVTQAKGEQRTRTDVSSEKTVKC